MITEILGSGLAKTKRFMANSFRPRAWRSLTLKGDY